MQIDFTTSRTVVYTAIFGDKDEPPTLQNYIHTDLSDFDFICFTDNPSLQSDFYKVIKVKRIFSDVTKNARFYKICGHQELTKYGTAIWHDSSVILDATKIAELASFSSRFALSTFKHGHICIYPEARQCIEMGKDSPVRIALQVLYYGLILNYPLRNGVYETTIMVKNQQNFNGSLLQKKWWQHLRYLSRRDQLSLPVARWISNQEIGILQGKGFDNPYSSYRGHRYYHYLTSNPFWRINNSLLRKIGVWVTYMVESFLAKKGLIGKEV